MVAVALAFGLPARQLLGKVRQLAQAVRGVVLVVAALDIEFPGPFNARPILPQVPLVAIVAANAAFGVALQRLKQALVPLFIGLAPAFGHHGRLRLGLKEAADGAAEDFRIEGEFRLAPLAGDVGSTFHGLPVVVESGAEGDDLGGVEMELLKACGVLCGVIGDCRARTGFQSLPGFLGALALVDADMGRVGHAQGLDRRLGVRKLPLEGVQRPIVEHVDVGTAGFERGEIFLGAGELGSDAVNLLRSQEGIGVEPTCAALRLGRVDEGPQQLVEGQGGEIAHVGRPQSGFTFGGALLGFGRVTLVIVFGGRRAGCRRRRRHSWRGGRAAFVVVFETIAKPVAKAILVVVVGEIGEQAVTVGRGHFSVLRWTTNGHNTGINP
ncbi:MAG: hypothetical protein EOS54_09645 [Mesorhizobium sp.]|nr:MAG: hypothetical protein EOS54_09645 [Mesorhizobium sp.]